jgi:hypothetical protein
VSPPLGVTFINSVPLSERIRTALDSNPHVFNDTILTEVINTAVIHVTVESSASREVDGFENPPQALVERPWLRPNGEEQHPAGTKKPSGTLAGRCSDTYRLNFTERLGHRRQEKSSYLSIHPLFLSEDSHGAGPGFATAGLWTPHNEGYSKGTRKTAGRQPQGNRLGKLAERVGFEPTCPLLAGKTLSRRPRYDHFGTSPSR